VKALVTGAAGFIGAHVVDALLAEGAAVRCFDAAEPAEGDRIGVDEWILGDVCDEDAVTRALDGCDAVFHLAAVYSYSRRDAVAMERVNVEGTRTVLRAAVRGTGRRVVLTSSAGTCGPVPRRVATEQDAPPRAELAIPYKRTTLAAELIALSAAEEGHDVVVVNPTTPVGPADRRPTPTGQLIADVVDGRIRAHVRTTINIVAVEDVARGHVLAHEHGRAGQRYLLGGENLPLVDVFATAAALADRPAPRRAIPYSVAVGAAWVADHATRLVGREPRLLNLAEVRLARLPMTFSSAKAEAELGYTSRPAAEALARAVAWFRERAPE
jgi:dihydroflavonol-4-reductase